MRSYLEVGVCILVLAISELFSCVLLRTTAALKIDLAYMCQQGSREKLILDVGLVLGLFEVLAYLNQRRPLRLIASVFTPFRDAIV